MIGIAGILIKQDLNNLDKNIIQPVAFGNLLKIKTKIKNFQSVAFEATLVTLGKKFCGQKFFASIYFKKCSRRRGCCEKTNIKIKKLPVPPSVNFCERSERIKKFIKI